KSLSGGRAPQAVRFKVNPPDNAVFEDALGLSLDGRWLVFVASASGGKSSLWLRPLDALEARALPGTEGASHPFWSPDSRFLGFFAQGKLKKMEVPDGPPQIISDASTTFSLGGTWNRDGVIVFAPHFEDPLFRISAAGGEATPVTAVDRNAREAHLWPHFLPDGRHFVYLGWGSPRGPRTSILVGSLDGKVQKVLLSANSGAAYASPGYLFFEKEQKLLAQPFDAERLQVAGEAAVIAQRVMLNGMSYPNFSVTETALAYWKAKEFGQSQLVWFDRQGKSLGSVGQAGLYQDPGLSPDEKQVAISHSDDGSLLGDILLFQLSQGIPSRFPFSPSFPNGFPVWSPDGKWIVFSANRTGSWELYQRPAS